ncbi:MAG: lipoprotein [Methylobacillus glycogenes]|nr:lipoprotein [Methylobacillus glycogenes]
MRPCLLILLSCLILAACGTKGDLYIPERQYPQDQPSAESQSNPSQQKQPASSRQTPVQTKQLD